MLNYSKKAAAIGDLIFIFATLFITIFVIVILDEPSDMVNQEFQNSSDIDSETKEFVDDYYSALPNFWDNAIIFVLILLTGALLVSSYFIDNHPIFLGVFVILIIFLLILMAMMSNVYEEMTLEDSSLSVSVVKYPKIHWLNAHWPHYVLFMAISSGIILFAKWRTN